MKVIWSEQALIDLGRLYDFLAKVNQPAALRVVERLTAAPRAILDQPRRGPVVEKYLPREVRRLLVSSYELRYEVLGTDVYIVGAFHTREDR